MSPPFACNLSAIARADRPRYNQLVHRLRAALEGQSELDDGYAYSLNERTISLPEVAEWIAMERLCCPFLSFQLDVSSGGRTLLSLRGPAGVKKILRAEFSASP